MEMKEFVVGNVYPEFRVRHDISKVDMDDSGLVAYIGFNKPSEKEIRSFHSQEPLQVRLVQMEDIAFFLFRFGTLNWIDAPFNVNLAIRLTTIPDIPDGLGINLIVFFFDTHSGRLISIRNIGLSTGFSRRFVNIMKETKSDSFDKDDYNRKVLAIQNLYSTDALVKKSQEELISNSRENKYKNISREQEKKAEAIARMKKMGISPEIIRKFAEQGIVSISMPPNSAFYQLSEEEEDMKRVRQFEAKYDVLVYMVIRSYTIFGKMDSFLFVSDHPEEWPIELVKPAFGADWCHVAYVYNYDFPSSSESGLVYLNSIPGVGLKRTW